jgi:hypothetical protein
MYPTRQTEALTRHSKLPTTPSPHHAQLDHRQMRFPHRWRFLAFQFEALIHPTESLRIHLHQNSIHHPGLVPLRAVCQQSLRTRVSKSSATEKRNESLLREVSFASWSNFRSRSTSASILAPSCRPNFVFQHSSSGIKEEARTLSPTLRFLHLLCLT